MQTPRFDAISKKLSDLQAELEAAKNDPAMVDHRAKLESYWQQISAIEATLEANQSDGYQDARSAWFLLPFGLVIGLLTALSTHVGITSTLIGLLFAAVGGSFIGWFNGNSLPALERRLLARYVCTMSVGLLIGLFVAFGLKAADPLITQALSRDKTAEETHERLHELATMEEEKLRKLRGAIITQLTDEISAEHWKAANWDKAAPILRYLEGQEGVKPGAPIVPNAPTASLPSPIPGKPGGPRPNDLGRLFELHSTSSSDLSSIRGELEEFLKIEKENLSEDGENNLKELTHKIGIIANKLDQSSHLLSAE